MPALNVLGMGSEPRAVLALQGFLTTLNVACGPLLHLLPVVAGVFHVLLAELAQHGSASVSA